MKLCKQHLQPHASKITAGVFDDGEPEHVYVAGLGDVKVVEPSECFECQVTTTGKSRTKAPVPVKRTATVAPPVAPKRRRGALLASAYAAADGVHTVTSIGSAKRKTAPAQPPQRKRSGRLGPDPV